MVNITVASDLVIQNMTEYGKHILSNHFSNPIDGLKKVKRRIIYTQRHKLDSMFSGLELISNTMRIHPYGDKSIYDAGTRMADTFRSSFPLLINSGKGGSYGGDKAASARYVDFKISDFCKDILFNGINFKTIPTEQTEDLSDIEIAYFIPKLPIALLYGSESIGFGFNSRTIPMLFENICDITTDYVSSNKKHWNYGRLANKFIPQLPIHVYIKNRDELVEGYRNGKFDTPIITEGYYKILSNNCALIKTLAYGIQPSSIRQNILNQLRDKNSWLAKNDIGFDALSDSKEYVDFRITAKRGANILEVLDKISGLLRLRTPTYIFPNYVFKDALANLDPPEIIKLWYKERYRSILGAKKHKQQDLHLEKMRLEAYLVIVDHVDDVIDLIKHNEVSVITRVLTEKYNLSLRQIDILINASISTLMKANREELVAKYDKLLNEIINHDTSFTKIDNEIIDEIAKLKRKYKTNSTYTSRESNYSGCLIIDKTGIIHIEDDLFDIAQMYPNSGLRYLSYEAPINHIQINKQVYENIQQVPYTSSNPQVQIRYRAKPWLFIRTNKTSIRNKELSIPTGKCIINWVSNNPWFCLPNGRFVSGSITQMMKEHQPTKILYAFDTDDIKGMIIVSVNSLLPNVIRLQHISDKRDKGRFSPEGETSVLGVVNHGKHIFHLPEWHKNSIIEIDTKMLKKEKLSDINIRSLRKI